MNKKVKESLEQLESALSLVDKTTLKEVLSKKVKHHHCYSINNLFLTSLQLLKRKLLKENKILSDTNR